MFTFQKLLLKSDNVLLKSMQDKANRINQLLPSSKTNGYMLRKRGHSFVLPSGTKITFSRSFLPSSFRCSVNYVSLCCNVTS